ncbi:hypothetical protein IRY44_21970 [Micromonospora sp. ANENR4]|uniref:hypothetical protein n=1 Tax=Micromonospora sp. ANENR4 TaxID=2783662 RepID=UPI00188E2338|nr:hypothetical protein [Micromonospora sp. ANENR4]MBF5032426.1 hypothetical protein [Micromonospora sp. ANENR4]
MNEPNDLDYITGHDPKRSETLRQLLDQLARSKNPLLREMATAVRDGELTLRQAATSDTYGAELAAPFQTFWNAYEKMTPEERHALTASS